MKGFLFFILIMIITISQKLMCKDSEEKWKEQVNKGEQLLSQQKYKEAIEKYLDPVITHFNEFIVTDSTQIYCARDSQESLIYMMLTAANYVNEENEDKYDFWGNRFSEKKEGAEVLGQFWAYAFYLKAYALIELNELEKARECLETAVGLSPLNSMYLSELGHLYQLEQNWEMSLQAYREAGGEAMNYSHADMEYVHQTRAWRGEGFVLIELGKFEEAKELFKKCLKFNKDDEKAKSELMYIENLESIKNQEE